MAKKKTAAEKTWTPANLAALANAWLAANPGKNLPAGNVDLPGYDYTPATPDQPATQPYLTPDQQAALNQILFDTGNQLRALDNADAQALSQTMLQIGDPNKFDPNDQGTDLTNQVNKTAMIDKTNATDAAIARGLFQSSIRAADLADVEATRQMRRNYFRDQYNSVIKTNADQRNAILSLLKTSVGENYDPNNPATLAGTYGAMSVSNAMGSPSAAATTGSYTPNGANPAYVQPINTAPKAVAASAPAVNGTPSGEAPTAIAGYAQKVSGSKKKAKKKGY